MKTTFFMAFFMLFFLQSCSSDKINEERIKAEVIGKRTKDWIFALPSEILDVDIVNKKKMGDVMEINANFILEDYKTKDHYFMNASLLYKKENGKWKLEKIYQKEYINISPEIFRLEQLYDRHDTRNH